MYCKNCGKELNEERFCPSCGTENVIFQQQSGDYAEQAHLTTDTNNLYGQTQKLVCPQCGNPNLQITTETNVTTSGKNFSGTKGCLGYLLFGPLGILCGGCGQSQKTNTTNKTYWVCPNCGKKFQNPNELRQTIKQSKISAKVVLWMDIITSLVFIIAGIAFLNDTGSGFMLVLGFFSALTMTIGWYVCVADAKKKETELNEIEQGIQKYTN